MYVVKLARAPTFIYCLFQISTEKSFSLAILKIFFCSFIISNNLNSVVRKLITSKENVFIMISSIPQPVAQVQLSPLDISENRKCFNTHI